MFYFYRKTVLLFPSILAITLLWMYKNNSEKSKINFTDNRIILPKVDKNQSKFALIRTEKFVIDKIPSEEISYYDSKINNSLTFKFTLPKSSLCDKNTLFFIIILSSGIFFLFSVSEYLKK